MRKDSSSPIVDDACKENLRQLVAAFNNSSSGALSGSIGRLSFTSVSGRKFCRNPRRASAPAAFGHGSAACLIMAPPMAPPPTAPSPLLSAYPPPTPTLQAPPPDHPQGIDETTEDYLPMIILVSLVLIAGPLCVALWVMWVLPWCRRRKIPWLKSRRLSKPFYRWAFRQGKLFTADSIDYFLTKYARKYLRKRQKLGVDQHLPVEASTSTSINSDEGSVHSKRSDHYLSGKELEDLASTALHALRSNQAVAAALEQRMPHVSASLRDAFARFAEGLYAATCKNIGLSHAKVREYWIYRGPKWVIITVGLLAALLIVDETLGQPTAGERMSRLASATIAMTASCVMLYFKLPDSIRSSVARSAHDFYVETKHTELGRRKTHLKRMGSPKTKRKNGAATAAAAGATTTTRVANGTPTEASQSAPSNGSERSDVDRGSNSPPTPSTPAPTATSGSLHAPSSSDRAQVEVEILGEISGVG